MVAFICCKYKLSRDKVSISLISPSVSLYFHYALFQRVQHTQTSEIQMKTLMVKSSFQSQLEIVPF